MLMVNKVMKNQKRYASLSLDLDDKWTYLKTHGDPDWENYPSYLDIVVPRMLEYFEKKKVHITFFIVGKDASIKKNHDILSQISSAGHDVANHSFNHDPWLHLYSHEEIDNELALAEKNILQATGKRTIGFRGPGFSHSTPLLNVLMKRGYLYDASTLPNFLSPLARAYFLSTSKLSNEEKEKRKKLFGKFSDGFKPNKPYLWKNTEKTLMEIPVTTMPVFKIPIHASYVSFIATYNKFAAIAYFKFAISLCKIYKVEPSILLHPLDFLGIDDTDDLAFFPSMKKRSNWKMNTLDQAIGMLGKNFELVDMDIFANRESLKSNLNTVSV